MEPLKYCMNFQIAIIAFLFVLSTTYSFPTSPSSGFNNLGKIRDLLLEQASQLRLRLNTNQQSNNDWNALVEFQNCFKRNKNRLDDNDLVVNYLFWVEGFELKLPCGPCAPSRRPLIWKRITFEGEESIADPFSKEYKYQSKSLVMTNPQADLSTYYCYWKFYPEHESHFISSIWTVEVVPSKLLKRVTYRSWRRKMNSDNVAATLFNWDHRIQVGMNWGPWSECSRCGNHVGKRHRLGFCSVTGAEINSFQALSMYNGQISCSLFLNLHPEVVSDVIATNGFDGMKNFTDHLGQAQTIMVGYCKVPCKTVPRGVIAENVPIPKEILDLYKSMPMNGTEPESDDDDDDDSSFDVNGEENKLLKRKSSFWLLKSILYGVPFTWKNLPEIIVLFSIISLQVYIVWQILKNRSEAR